MAITNKEKADLLGKKLASIHLDEVHKQQKDNIIRKCSDVLRKKDTLEQHYTWNSQRMS